MDDKTPHTPPQSSEEKPPLFKSWRSAYLLVLGTLALLIAIFYAITQYYA